jgi:hypothetical protein
MTLPNSGYHAGSLETRRDDAAGAVITPMKHLLFPAAVFMTFFRIEFSDEQTMIRPVDEEHSATAQDWSNQRSVQDISF